MSHPFRNSLRGSATSLRESHTRENQTVGVSDTDDGADDTGARVGVSDTDDGSDDTGARVGVSDTDGADDTELGVALGVDVGSSDGDDDGLELGLALGASDNDGLELGVALGADVGTSDGEVDKGISRVGISETDAIVGEKVASSIRDKGGAVGNSDGIKNGNM